MVLRYMLSDTDLAKGEAVEAGAEGGQPVREIAPPRKWKLLPRIGLRFWLLFVVSLILGGLYYHYKRPEGASSILQSLAPNKRMVTGIMYNPDNPCAIVRGEVVYEGDTVNGWKVVKIYKNKVLFEKDGKTFTEQL